jgi:hypothetical protein
MGELENVYGVEFFDGDDGRPVVVLSEHRDNKGRSITNAYEFVATDVLAQLRGNGLQIEPTKVRWFECKPRVATPGQRTVEWSEVLLCWDGASYHSPQWIWLREDPDSRARPRSGL